MTCTCKSKCDPVRAPDHTGYQTTRLRKRTWHYAPRDAACSICVVMWHDVPDDVSRCPCCNIRLRRLRWSDGTPTGRRREHMKVTARKRAARLAARAPRTCRTCGKAIALDADARRIYCSKKCAWSTISHRNYMRKWAARKRAVSA